MFSGCFTVVFHSWINNEANQRSNKFFWYFFSIARIDVLMLKSKSNKKFLFLYRFNIREYILACFLQRKTFSFQNISVKNDSFV